MIVDACSNIETLFFNRYIEYIHDIQWENSEKHIVMGLKKNEDVHEEVMGDSITFKKLPTCI